MKTHTSARRRTRHLHVQTDATAEAERLDALTEVLEATLAADQDHPPTLVVALDHGDEVEVRLRGLDHHPATELEGFVAPPSWWCLGVISGADARPVPEWPTAAPDQGSDRFRVHLAHLMTRTGRSSRALRDRRTDEVVVHGAAGDAETAATSPGSDHGGGLLDDYLRCALGVATPPPHRSTAGLFTALWIHDVMTDAADHRLLHAPWPEVAALHPVLQVPFQDDHPLLRDWVVANLVRAGELLAEAQPWERVRLACQEGVGPVTGRPAELAGWFDEGAFARAVLSGFAPLEDLLADLHDLLRREVHAQLVDTIGAWGLLDGS